MIKINNFSIVSDLSHGVWQIDYPDGKTYETINFRSSFSEILFYVLEMIVGNVKSIYDHKYYSILD